MKLNKQEQDGEEIPIMTSDNFDIKNSKKFSSNKFIHSNKIILIFFIIFLCSIIIFYLIRKYNDYQLLQTISKLEKKIEKLEFKIKDLDESTIKRKLGIGIVQSSLYGNGIGRIISILTELLAKTGKYDVYLAY
jgi:cell division protein FtsL